MSFIMLINRWISILFVICYTYQILYLLVALLHRPVLPLVSRHHRYAVLIAARNEQAVIALLIESIRQQTYPCHLVEIYVIADNCSDQTAEVARKAGAQVIERFNKQFVGKGYALQMLFSEVLQRTQGHPYDGYFVFDADNLLDSNYIEAMNRVFAAGHPIITSYRNSKNYTSNWISAGYSLWFLRESRYLNQARMLLGISCCISGTGFLIDHQTVMEHNGWKHFLLTEDLEFTVDVILAGKRIAYCPDAILYDEQPVTWSQSWTQRLRWTKGYMQVFAAYGSSLLGCLFKRCRLACLDIILTIMPAFVLSAIVLSINLAAILIGLVSQHNISALLSQTVAGLLIVYLSLYAVGLITTLSEWRWILGSPLKKIWATVTFPIFMLTYIPIALTSLFKKVVWQPTPHTCAVTLSQIKAIKDKASGA
ncbi:MAG: glycosyltransferase family 2 protein [Bacillota bacterium]|nr:glycosyltransferase family 2 protein [Bacillota bacterium]